MTYLIPIKFEYRKNQRNWWSYRCIYNNCNNTTIIPENRFKTKNTKSCGCYRNIPSQKRGINRVGQKYSRLTLIERFTKRNSIGTSLVWYKCLCDCGKFCEVGSGQLISNNTKSCGCLDKEKTIQRNQDPVLISKRRTFGFNKYKITHWKTNKELHCSGSWEYGTLLYLNYNKIDYEWQVKFLLNEKKVYICDLYLKNENKYVEIKGRWLGDAEEKFNKVKEMYKNYTFELWNWDKLEEMKIINSQGKMVYERY